MLPARMRILIAAAFVGLASLAWCAGAGAVTLPFTATAQQGLFLHISDIHFDPFADKKLVKALVAAPVEQWESIFQSSPDKRFPHPGQDTNFRLFMSMLSAAEGNPYDYVLNTGDELAHEFRFKFFDAVGNDGDYQDFVIKTLLFLDLMLKKSFPGVPLIATIGNNDSVCGDYWVAPHSTMLEQLAHDLPVVAGNARALRDFNIGGFYLVPHPTVPRHDMIVLNSIFWSPKYRDKCNPRGGDPGDAELDWLGWTLYREKLTGRTATLVMHIPPGIDPYSSAKEACPRATSFWRTRYTRRFLALTAAYQDVLRDSYAGHTHMDTFSVVADAAGTPFLTTRITPSVSPVFGNNPAFTVLLYDRSDAGVRDYATFYLADLANAGAHEPGHWKLAYDFAQTYGTRGYTPAHLAAVAKRLHNDASLRQSFIEHYAADISPPAIKSNDPDNWLAYVCAQTALTPDAYAVCRCPSVPVH